MTWNSLKLVLRVHEEQKEDRLLTEDRHPCLSTRRAPNSVPVDEVTPKYTGPSRKDRGIPRKENETSLEAYRDRRGLRE